MINLPKNIPKILLMPCDMDLMDLVNQFEMALGVFVGMFLRGSIVFHVMLLYMLIHINKSNKVEFC